LFHSALYLVPFCLYPALSVLLVTPTMPVLFAAPFTRDFFAISTLLFLRTHRITPSRTRSRFSFPLSSVSGGYGSVSWSAPNPILLFSSQGAGFIGPPQRWFLWRRAMVFFLPPVYPDYPFLFVFVILLEIRFPAPRSRPF